MNCEYMTVTIGGKDHQMFTIHIFVVEIFVMF